ncbi:carboxypeptidase-like regulatory domain-containing protein [Hanstruepera marina]|uniref:carboxypeptidase-like regulatory domain-containing protein n=1 Tax=Hanstruepera marina TaxID=2873265 RepID=UPI001CA69DFB|nr:carboxypeptidase-like regulatory domain-containing protein [Hanstruepera marina]
MARNNLLLIFALTFVVQTVLSQEKELVGKVISPLDVENVHVINKTAQKFTITNIYGEFRITASVNDTLIFSSIQHKLLSVVVDKEIIKGEILEVRLEQQINALDQVVVGKVLSGDILSDIGNVEGEPMTSKKAGIPGYQGPPKTQSERRLIEATSGGGIVPLNPILNAISGRTKELKNRIKLEEKEALMYDIKVRLSESLFKMNPLDDKYVLEYFYFVSESDDFLKRCKNVNDIEVLEFLNERLNVYKNNLKK